MTALPLTVYGVNQSFFTRKVTGYLDYKRLPWRLHRGLGLSPEVRAGGWDGGLPAVIDADGAVSWDSTSVILHLEHHRGAPVLAELARFAGCGRKCEEREEPGRATRNHRGHWRT